MTITVEQKTQTVLNIELPAYYRYEVFLYKILSETSAICVIDHPKSFGISKSSVNSPGIIEAVTKGIRISEDSFCKTFERVAKQVKDELVAALQSELETVQS